MATSDLPEDGERVAPRAALFVPPIPLGSHRQSNFTVTGEATLGAYSMVELRGWKEGQGPEAHTHTHEDEAWYVLEGELRFVVGKQEINAPAGSFILAPKGLQHVFRVSKGPAGFLLMFFPAGAEGLFREREEIDRRYGVEATRQPDRLQPASPEHREAIEELRRKYGLIFE